MPRPKGSKVVTCNKCQTRIVGMPGMKVKCTNCGNKQSMPKLKPVKVAAKKAAPKKKKKTVVNTVMKKVTKKAPKKVAKKAA